MARPIPWAAPVMSATFDFELAMRCQALWLGHIMNAEVQDQLR
jgi:hypothetical protein